MCTRDIVLICAPSDDIHAVSVATELIDYFNFSVIRWNTSGFPLKDKLSYYPNTIADNYSINIGGYHLPTERLKSIWWRRPKRPEISQEIKSLEIRKFCLTEADVFFRGFCSTLMIPIYNKPEAELAAQKPIQLYYAKEVGLRIPNTIMSNDPEEIELFWKNNNSSCIFKAYTSPSWQIAETRILTKDMLSELSLLKYAPIIVQEYIPKLADIRVSIFIDDVFAGESRTHNSVEVDWRLDLKLKWEHHELPNEVKEKLILLLKKLNLHSGAIDLILTPNGDYIFIEVNPSGQFLFLEIDTRQKLSRSCAAMLVS